MILIENDNCNVRKWDTTLFSKHKSKADDLADSFLTRIIWFKFT